MVRLVPIEEGLPRQARQLAGIRRVIIFKCQLNSLKSEQKTCVRADCPMSFQLLHSRTSLEHLKRQATSSRSFRPAGVTLKILTDLQDELYLHYLIDACHDAVRRLLGPRRALLWNRHAPAEFSAPSTCCLLAGSWFVQFLLP